MASEVVLVDPTYAEAISPALAFTHTVGTVGTVTGTVLAANNNRKYARFQNDSDTVIYIKFNAVAAVNQGIRLAATGGTFEVSYMLGNLSTTAVQAISSADSKLLLVTEGA